MELCCCRWGKTQEWGRDSRVGAYERGYWDFISSLANVVDEIYLDIRLRAHRQRFGVGEGGGWGEETGCLEIANLSCFWQCSQLCLCDPLHFRRQHVQSDSLYSIIARQWIHASSLCFDPRLHLVFLNPYAFSMCSSIGNSTQRRCTSVRQKLDTRSLIDAYSRGEADTVVCYTKGSTVFGAIFHRYESLWPCGLGAEACPPRGYLRPP
jgi:hypothetical protein